MALLTPNVFTGVMDPRPAFGGAGSFNQTTVYNVAASQTIQVGDVLALSSGVFQQAIALPGSNNSSTLSGGALPLLGIAMDSITSNSSGVDNTSLLPKTTVPILLFDANLEQLMQIWNATAANTTISNITLGTSYQLGRWRGASASQWGYFISTTTTNGEIQYVEPYGVLPYLSTTAVNNGPQSSTTQYAAGWTRINQAYRQVGG